MPRHPGIRYVFRDEQPLTFKNSAKANAQKIGKALEQITAASGGHLTPKAVVNHARDEASVLHPHFEWDDVAAAEKWREDQARTIIRCIRIEPVEEGAWPEPAYLSVSDGGTSYRTLTEIKGSVALQHIVLAAAERDLNAFTFRYRTLRDVCAHVEKAKDALKTKRSKSETRASA